MENQEQPTTITYKDKEYPIADLSDQAKAIVMHLQEIGEEEAVARKNIERMEAARATFINMLEQELGISS